MPCRTDDWVPTQAEKAITRNRELTNMLCAMCTTFLSGVENPGNTAIKDRDGLSYNKEIWTWWAEHLEEDRKRVEARNAAAKKQKHGARPWPSLHPKKLKC